ncbi:MAG: TerB family tellurite resistance protein [Myxococcales bacterium]|nr:TerB family tellurite resistance protein [Myxococcales bacterium]
MAGIEDPQVRWELCKLLLQVAWAEHEVDAEARQLLGAIAERLGLGQAQRDELARLLSGGAPLPAPDLGLLRAHRSEVIELAEELVLADGVIGDDENRVLAELTELLG